ncbi:unnamed protein product [Gadus morhua 'NCC']
MCSGFDAPLLFSVRNGGPMKSPSKTHTDRQTDRQTGRQAGQADRKADGRSRRKTGRQTDRYAERDGPTPRRAIAWSSPLPSSSQPRFISKVFTSCMLKHSSHSSGETIKNPNEMTLNTNL